MSQEPQIDGKSHAVAGISGASVVDSTTMNEKIEDAPEALDADERHDEIALDHALAKSSNVASPQDDDFSASSPLKSIYPPNDDNDVKPQLQITTQTTTSGTTTETTTQLIPETATPSVTTTIGVSASITPTTASTSSTSNSISVTNSEPLSNSSTSAVIDITSKALATTNTTSNKDITEKQHGKILNFQKTVPKEVEVISLEDDFFSMYTPRHYPEKKKKRKKKGIKVQASESSSALSPIILDSSAATSPERKSDDVIVIEDENDYPTKEPPTKKKKLRALTPPPIDEVAFRKQFLLDRASQKRMTQQPLDDDDGDNIESLDSDTRLAYLDRLTKSIAAENKGLQRSSTTDSLGSEEAVSRDYLLKITSHLPGSTDLAIDMNVKGTKRIGTIIKKALQSLLGLEIVPTEYHHLYNPDNITLFWNSMSLRDVSRVDSLGIPVPLSGKPAVVELGMYTISQANEIQEVKRIQEREKLERIAREAEIDKMLKAKIGIAEVEDPFEDDEEFREVDRETSLRATEKEASNGPEEEEDDDEEGYFKIGLLGEDNKKIIVKVNAETKLINLVKHYLEKKGLPETSKVKLSFDNDDIELTGKVGDTDLEDEDTLEVYVK